MISKLKLLPFRYHIIVSVIIRIILIYYGEFHDSLSEVPYTDVDYNVITDSARHVLNNDSPFKRHTYRYTPILAYIVIPNFYFHQSFGKLLFSFFDILVGIFIKIIVLNELKETFFANSNVILKRYNLNKIVKTTPYKYETISNVCSLFWFYNPLSMVIATRGNGDSVSSLLVLISLYLLLHPKKKLFQYFLAGVFHGLAIHFRLYPLVFSLPYYLTTSSRRSNLLKSMFLPNSEQILLVSGTILTLTTTTLLFFLLYGYDFLNESFIYHLIRKDTRHNFSMFFYMQYLTSDQTVSILEKLLTFLPQLITLVCLSFTFGRHRKTLPFCLFAQSFTMVTYNPVVTSQYFVWFLSLLPLCLHNFRNLSYKSILVYGVIWILGQCGWLLPAYMLEFKGWNTFDFIWLQGIMFFSVNIYILQRLIVNFNVVSDFKTTLN